MGKVKIRHYVVKKGRGYWQPTKRMKKLGFQSIPLGIDGPAAWTEAERLNAQWDGFKNEETEFEPIPVGSLQHIFIEYRKTQQWADKAPATKNEWEYAWHVIGPVLGLEDVTSIDFPTTDTFYTTLRDEFSPHKAHRIFKIFRALMHVAIAYKLISTSPADQITNAAPAGRDKFWLPDEIPVLKQTAWDHGYRGLSVAIQIAYDTGLSPVDVRTLTMSQKRSDQLGTYFETRRTKTGKRAYGTLSPAAEILLEDYLQQIGVFLPDHLPFIRHRSGRPYTKDKFGQDFRKIREICFPGDDRTLGDMRTTSNVESAVGGATPSQLSAKSGNSIGQSNKLHDTYVPTQLANVRQADAARERGRNRLKKNKR